MFGPREPQVRRNLRNCWTTRGVLSAGDVHTLASRCHSAPSRGRRVARLPGPGACLGQPTGRAVLGSIQASRSSLVQQCAVCWERQPVVALTPCGHLVCTSCHGYFVQGRECPVCRQSVNGHQNLFAA
mmetsp:Transcript_15588/g.43080  ORF Transcript_15588/g.43080 Transcript_15588/m.43080 type:complete len:128 (-) Transcript_15588:146-529(-)